MKMGEKRVIDMPIAAALMASNNNELEIVLNRMNGQDEWIVSNENESVFLSIPSAKITEVYELFNSIKIVLKDCEFLLNKKEPIVYLEIYH